MTEMQPKKPFLSTLSDDAFCKLRDEVAALPNSCLKALEQLNGAQNKRVPKYQDGLECGI